LDRATYATSIDSGKSTRHENLWRQPEGKPMRIFIFTLMLLVTPMAAMAIEPAADLVLAAALGNGEVNGRCCAPETGGLCDPQLVLGIGMVECQTQHTPTGAQGCTSATLGWPCWSVQSPGAKKHDVCRPKPTKNCLVSSPPGICVKASATGTACRRILYIGPMCICAGGDNYQAHGERQICRDLAGNNLCNP
jgi:hypothetical protein